VRKSERKFIVFTSLVAALTLTSALLLALAPAPLAPSSSSLFAIDTPQSLDAIFDTAAPLRGDQWKYIYIHHSLTAKGNAATLGQKPGGFGDHFLIGNGQGAEEGEIQISPRWNEQKDALPPAGANQIDPACISICVVGDFDTTLPTATQMRVLTKLVTTLQARFRVPADHILLAGDVHDSAAGSGRYFPLTAFREGLIP
jgi:hypothetical protein